MMKSFERVTTHRSIAAALLLLAFGLWPPTQASAQWTSAGGTTTTADKVGVGLGTGATPGAQLEVKKDQAAAAAEVRVSNPNAGGRLRGSLPQRRLLAGLGRVPPVE